MKDDFQLFPDVGHADSGVDPDISLVSAYLAGELSLVQIAAVEDRLAGDRAFRAKVQPIVDAWLIPVSLASGAPRRSSVRAGTSLSAAEVEAGWQRITKGREAVPAGPRLVAPQEISPMTSRRKSMTRAASIIAAIALPMVGLAQAAVYAARHQDAPAHAVARRVVAPFVDVTPAKLVRVKRAQPLTAAEDIRLGTQLIAPHESAATFAGKAVTRAPIVFDPVVRAESPAAESRIAAEPLEPDRAQIARLVSQYQPEVARGAVSAEYILMVFDAKGQYKWSTAGTGSLRLQVDGDTRSVNERQKYAQQYREQFFGTPPMAGPGVGPASDSIAKARRVLSDSLSWKIAGDTSRMSVVQVYRTDKPPYAIARTSGDAIGTDLGRLASLDTSHTSVRGYRAGWMLSVDGRARENNADGLEAVGNGRSGIIGLASTSLAKADYYIFHPGEILTGSQLRVMAVYLTPDAPWKK